MDRNFEVTKSRLRSPISRVAFSVIKLTARTRIGQKLLTLCTLFTINQVKTTTIRGHQFAFSFVEDTWLPRRFLDVEKLEPDTLTWIDQATFGSILWDIGANVGGYSIYAAKSRQMRVFAFEPSPFNLEFLARNIWLNNMEKQVTVIPNALAEFISISPFEMKRIEWAGSGSTFNESAVTEMKSSGFTYTTIGLPADKVCATFQVPQPQFIKLDVDGIESLILAGATQILSTATSVLIEVQDSDAERQKIGEQLTRAGLTKSKTARQNEIWARK